MKLHQINFAYHPQEDRILMRISGESKDEIRIWLTRNSLKQFSSQAHKWLHFDQSDSKNQKTSLKQDEAGVNDEISKKFHDGSNFPLGENPLLATSIIINSEKSSYSIVIDFIDNQKMTLNLAEEALVGIQRILSDTIIAADWSLPIGDKSLSGYLLNQASITKH